VAIVENIQRKDLSPIEEAKSYKKLLDRGYLTQDQLASRMGKNQSTVSNKLRLLNLDEKVQDALLNNKISERHARSLLKLDNKEEQKKVLDEIIEKRLNVRDTEDLINRKLNGEEEFINIPNLSNTGIEETFDSNNIPNISNDYKNEEEIEKIPTFSSNPIKEYKENDDDIEVISDFDNDIINVPSLSIAKKEKNIDDVISKIQKVVEEVKELGFEAKLEEYDFDGLYQFVIKVDNEN
jgi:ParB-like chromosome segregation protein Spo0J